MTLLGAAVCPHPPMLVPELAAGAVAELDDLRAACDAAVAELLDLRPDLVVVVGAGDGSTRRDGAARAAAAGQVSSGTAVAPGARTGLARWGRTVTLPAHAGADPALSVAIGCWLLARAGWRGDVRLLVLDPDTPAAAAAGLGADAAATATAAAGSTAGSTAGATAGSTATATGRSPATTGARESADRIAAPTTGTAEPATGATAAAGAEPRVVLLVLGDGSARRSVAAPGHLDERASAYDDAVARALATADVHTLLALDPVLAADLLVAGRVAWQALAGAAADGRWTGELRYAGAPHGVGYFVASWRRA